jgi:hypothetical protein
MKCPKCSFDQPDGSECLRCGIVYSKYVPGESPHAIVYQRAGESDLKTDDRDGSEGNLLFSLNPEMSMFALAGRAIVFVVILIWGMRLIFSSVESNFAGNSFMHLINLPFHEAGHIIFGFFGRFISVFGGTLMQLLVPFICMLAFLFRTRDAFAASVSLWWLGENLIDIAPYINDARALKLILLGGVTGRDVEDYHDWEYILRTTGLLEYDHFLARLSHFTGAILMILALFWGGWLLFRQFNMIRSGDK